jgi:prefoldin alpha subunit
MEQTQNQEQVFKAAMLQQQTQEMQQNLEIIENQISELEDFQSSLGNFQKDQEILASLGKGVHLPSKITSDKLFVEVGSGVVIRKTPEETKSVIASQLSRLEDVKLQIDAQIETNARELQNLMNSIQGQ